MLRYGLMVIVILGLLIFGVGTANAQEPEHGHEVGHDTPYEHFHHWLNDFMLKIQRIRDCFFFSQQWIPNAIQHTIVDLVDDCYKLNNHADQ